ncbi:PREDICTED: sodium-driven chloride bicarbonate exchanger [Thamnophis sirtalis]|uniref:Anion exchange protein n=1 Tax=Thamnophis sirtalis TaxID=35019 RepID=A0A6I9YEZ3_9SAUR|nr:PREDICTED: sodium-driven chloride bicarbonate exchanger [Thamnophis sirtalis]
MEMKDQGAQMEPLLPTLLEEHRDEDRRQENGPPSGICCPNSTAYHFMRNDEEAVVDQGGTRSILNTHFEKEDLEGHRTLFIGVHVPLGGRKSHRRHRHRGHKHRKRDRERDSGLEDGRESPSFDTPSQRVQFILGTEDDDEEHIPHDLFTELDELCLREGDDTEWRETARWLKFEEDVEDGGERWSKPYVATLSLHSLFELRSCILNGTVLLDMRANSLEEIADMILDQQVGSGQLSEDVRHRVHEALLKQHHHQNQKKLSNRIPIVRSFADIGKKQSEPHSMDKNAGQIVSPQSAPTIEIKNDVSRENSTVDFSKGLGDQQKGHNTSLFGMKQRNEKGHLHQEEREREVDMHFMKKIPPGAEASNILVGELEFLDRAVVAFVRLSPAMLLSGLTEVPIPSRFLFILLGPLGKGQQYHEIGRSIGTLMTDEVFHDVAYKAKDRSDLVAGIDEFLDQVTVLPPGEWDPTIRIEPPKNVPSQEKRKIPGVPNGTAAHGDPEPLGGHSGPELQRTGKLFGGLVLDIKRKVPFLLSDFTDAFSLQCLASFLFLYCACMSPVITFGGLLGEATDGRISAIESLFGASMTGIAYSLFGGQPLTILGSTGPVLVFEKILFKFCKREERDTTVYIVIQEQFNSIAALLGLENYVWYHSGLFNPLQFICDCPRGKDGELNYSFLIERTSTIDLFFRCSCVEPDDPSNTTLQYWQSKNMSSYEIPWANLTVTECQNWKGIFVGRACGEHEPYVPDVLFWSVILFFSTVILSSTLKQFKTSRYFPTKVRSVISDFAVFLTILSMVIVDYFLGIPSPKLQVPNVFKPTRDDRGWIVSPLGPNPWWTVLAALIPALLCTILIFMDQQITAVIINRKEHKLKKGCGYHLDLLMVALMLGVCSIMGLPWFVAATVLSISHVNSLKLESECSAPGEQPKFLGIREQRVTGLMIFILMGCSVFLTRVLKFIPMPVLYGVFLYMGASSLKGIQLFDRIKLFWMPAKHQPDFIYLRHVPLRKVHLFTVIQLTCLVLLWVIKVSRAAIVFPMMVLALVFVRKLMDFFFTKRELSWLDDLMPESKKKKLEDAEKEEEQSMLAMEEEGTVQLPLEGHCRDDPSVINISDEMAKSDVWKTMLITSENAKDKESSFPAKSTEGRREKKADSGKGVDRETCL